MHPELQLILSSNSLHSSEAEFKSIDALIPEIQDWDYFSSQIIDRGLAPLFYKKIQQQSNSQSIPSRVQLKLRSAYYKTVSRSMMLYGAFHEVVQEFNKAGITVIALKGAYLSEHLYRDIGLRLMSDIDLLVKKEDGERCLELLKGLGYLAMPFQKNMSEFTDKVGIESFLESGEAHYRPMLKDEVSVEIHTKLQNTSEKHQQNLNEIWANAKAVTINGLPAMALDNYNLLIHLCLHLHKHFTVLEHVQFTGFADIVNLLCRFDNRQQNEDNGRQTTDDRLHPDSKGEIETRKDINNSPEELPLGRGAKDFVWEEFIDRCKQIDAEEPVFKYLLLCREYFNAPLPDYLYEAYRHTFTDRDRDLFYKHLTGYDFAADRDNSAVPVHIRNIKHIKNPLLKLRYLVEVVFPPKEFMISKYLNQCKMHNGKWIIKEEENQCKMYNGKCIIKEEENQCKMDNGKCIIKEQEIQTSTNTTIWSKIKKKLCILGRAKRQSRAMHYKLLIKYWWLWYPYRWWTALRALFASRY